ncbi:MAG: ABC transporter ATP-binding protein [Propionibacteriaceae bacterium]|jgi:iron(III) transport system ATP-binding protein|nr:ABC transporter ATP-binding protein [Propionibacteriaceae bacterium]
MTTTDTIAAVKTTSTPSATSKTAGTVGSLKDFSSQSSGVRLVDITKVFPTPEGTGETIAVNNVNLDVEDGELVTLLGPSGCGKTTTLRMVSGFEYPSAGHIYIGNRDVANVPPNKRGIAMVFQSYALFPHMSIWENVAYGLRTRKLPKEEVIARTDKVLKLMDIAQYQRRFPNQLSGGQQQRVALARAVVIEPAVLLFDEPLSNLDAKLRERMRDELRSLQQRLGITSIYVTHDQAEAMAISDRVVIMKDGNLVQAGSPEDIYEYPTSTFVANFIGKANFVTATFVRKDGPAAIVRVPGEDVELVIPKPGKIEFKEGARCCLAFRPEHVALSRSGQGFPGQVTRATYFGDMVEYVVETKTASLTIEVNNPQISERFAVGDMVHAALDMDCVRLLADDAPVVE